MFEMPILIPQPIEIKHVPYRIKVWRWIFYIREWKLHEDWYFTMPDGTDIKISKGYILDGASVPRPLWGVLSPVGLLLIPSIIHDFGYEKGYLIVIGGNGKETKYLSNYNKRNWDDLFYEISNFVNGKGIINFLSWKALLFFGGYSWKKYEKNRKQKNQDC